MAEKQSSTYKKEEVTELQYKMPDEQQDAHDLFIRRRKEMKAARQNVQGINIEEIWRAADKAYVPHTLKTAGKETMVSDDEIGWRSSLMTLGTSDDWMEDSAPTNPYTKIQTAISILVDRNPEGVFKAFAEKFEPNSKLMKELHRRNWEIADSREMLKVVLLNACKYGIIAGHTSPLKITRKVKELVGVNPDRYEESEVVVYDDVYRWALDPWAFWVDEMARPGDAKSISDWVRYKDYSYDAFKEQFEHLDACKYVKLTAKKVDLEDSAIDPELDRQDLVRVWYYENAPKDLYHVETDGGIVLVSVPLPASPKNKRLTLWIAPFTLRHSNTVYGIGMYEAMRNNYKIFLKFRNMTMDQVTQSIYKGFLYSGTSTLQGDGQMKVKPGQGTQVSDAKNVSWNEIPGPGADAWAGLDWIEKKIDEDVGISSTLEGELSPTTTAFDIAQAREASLKRLKTPLDNIGYALEQDAYISVGYYQELYSIPEMEEITDPKEMADYQEKIARGEMNNQNVSQIVNDAGMPGLEVKKYREFPLFLEKDKEGGLLDTKEEQFFTIDPEDLAWEGKISIKGQSIIPESPLLEKQNILELSNLIIPLFMQPYEVVGKAATELLKQYDQKPEDWFPDMWLQAMAFAALSPEEQMMMQEQAMGQQPLIVDQQQPGMAPQGGPTMQGPQMQQTNKVVPSAEVSPAKSGVGSFLGKLNPFNK